MQKKPKISLMLSHCTVKINCTTNITRIKRRVNKLCIFLNMSRLISCLVVLYWKRWKITAKVKKVLFYPSEKYAAFIFKCLQFPFPFTRSHYSSFARDAFSLGSDYYATSYLSPTNSLLKNFAESQLLCDLLFIFILL